MKFSGKISLAPRLMAGCAGAVLVGSAAMAEGPTQVDKGIDIAPFCGTDPIRVALVDGWGGDTWRKITFAELRDEASKCPNVTAEDHTDAGGDQQTYNAAINGYSTQGYEIVLAFTDFGDAAIPAYRQAHAAGTTMVPYFGVLSGTPGVDYAVNPYQDSVAIGRQYADWLNIALNGEGNVLMSGGPAGAASSADFLKGFKEGLTKYPGLKLLEENYIAMNWNPADAQKAAAGLIAKYGDTIDAIASDYGVTSLATVKAFQQAGMEVPAIATIATSNELNCMYIEATKNGTAWKYLALDGSTADVRFALRQALAVHNGVEITEPLGVVPYVYADSVTGVMPKCSDTAPPDADLSSLLSEDKLNALFQQ